MLEVQQEGMTLDNISCVLFTDFFLLQFLKEEGCNKITCPCKATMCYICRAKNVDYNHFYGQVMMMIIPFEGAMHVI